MLSTTSILLALPLLAPLAKAIITPVTPDSSGVYRTGANCPIAWTADPDGVWNSFTIQLMTGPNSPMVELEVVAAGLDGTAGGTTSFSFPCPSVDTNAPIYFYQFSQPGVSTLTWTTRFTIASATGATVAAPNDADSITPAPWGTGRLTGASAQGITTDGINGVSGSQTAALGAGAGSGTSTGAGLGGAGAAGATTTPAAAGATAGAGSGAGAGSNTFTTAPGNGTPPGSETPSPTTSGTFVPYSPGESAPASGSGNAKSAGESVRVQVLGWSDWVLLGVAVWVGVGMM